MLCTYVTSESKYVESNYNVYNASNEIKTYITLNVSTGEFIIYNDITWYFKEGYIIDYFNEEGNYIEETLEESIEIHFFESLTYNVYDSDIEEVYVREITSPFNNIEHSVSPEYKMNYRYVETDIFVTLNCETTDDIMIGNQTLCSYIENQYRPSGEFILD